MKIVCYGVRPIEEPYFKKLNKYNFELKLTPEFLNDRNASLAEGMDAVLLRGNCAANSDNLKQFADYGIKYIFTRTVGFNHIDLEAATKLGIQVARVPNYSPYAVAELALTLGMQLFRPTNIATTNSAHGDFRVLPSMFSKQIHSSTVGIIGAGKIGYTEALLYHGMGTRVIAYDPHPSAAAKQFIEFKSMDEVLAESDIVSLHVPYFPGKNENLIDADSIAKMKSSAILINTARGELVDTQAVIEAIKDQQLAGYGADVTVDEKEIMGNKFETENDIPNDDVRELVKLYPKVLVTPHIGSFTEPALEDMISISFDNFHQSLETGSNDNLLNDVKF